MNLLSLVLLLMSLVVSNQATALVLDPIEMNLRDSDQRLTNIGVSTIEAKTGYRLEVPVILQNSKRDIDENMQAVLERLHIGIFAYETSVIVGVNGKWSESREQNVQKCLTNLTTRGMLAVGVLKKSILIHEAFHCFQFNWAHTFNGSMERGSWLVEGTAMFVGEDIVGETTTVGQTYLNQYAIDIKNILDRSYDAYPFFLHLKHEGVNVYPLFRQLFEAPADEYLLWRKIVQNVPHRALMTWAASVARKPEWGPDWELKTNSDYSPPRTVTYPYAGTNADFVPFSVVGDMGLPMHDELTLAENRPVKLSITDGVAAIHYSVPNSAEGRTYFLEEGKSIQFCYGDSCDCPDGFGAVQTITVSDPVIFVASISLEATHTLRFENAVKSCCDNQGEFDQRMVGTWQEGHDRMLAIWAAFPTQGESRRDSGTGGVEFVIGTRGEFVKRYSKLKLFSEISNRRQLNTIEFEMMYEMSGCLTTRSINENRGWLHISELLDQIEWTKTTVLRPSPMTTVESGHGEWPFFSVCAGKEPCSGTYVFDEGKLRIHGGLGNNVYMNLERVVTP